MGAQGCAGAQVRRRGQREGAEGRESAGGRRGWQQACESMKVEQARLSASMSAESPRLAFWASEMAYSSCFSDGAPAARKPAARYATPLASLGTTSSLGTPPAACVSFGGSRGRNRLVTERGPGEALSLLGRAQATQRTQRSIGQRQGGPCGPTYRTLAIFTRYRPHTRYRYTYTGRRDGWSHSTKQASCLYWALRASGFLITPSRSQGFAVAAVS